MEQNTYYTPKISEFHFGFEFEFFNTKDKMYIPSYEENTWIKTKVDLGVLGDLSNINQLILDKQVRVKIKERKIHEMTPDDWSEIVVYIYKKVLGKLNKPYPIGIEDYAEEVIESLRRIKDGTNKLFCHNRLAPILTIEFIPYFVVKWLKDKGYCVDCMF